MRRAEVTRFRGPKTGVKKEAIKTSRRNVTGSFWPDPCFGVGSHGPLHVCVFAFSNTLASVAQGVLNMGRATPDRRQRRSNH